MEEDRLSKLPDEVILHILSFLPTEDVVRTCLLSKHWKLMWYSVPTLSFSDADPDIDSQEDEDIEKVYKYVDNYLKHRKTSKNFMVDSTITSFKLQMMSSYQIYKDACIDKWLAFAAENKVKEISVCLNLCRVSNRFYGHYNIYYVRYRLPNSIVNSNDLTILKLNGLVIDLSTVSYSIRLPALKTLLVNTVLFTNDDVLFKLSLGCPSLEEFLLHSCDIENGPFRFQSLSLKVLEVEYDDFASPLQLEATNLESLVVNRYVFEGTNLSACKAIRNLSLTFDWNIRKLEDPSLPLEDLISNLPLLESLTLEECANVNLKQIKISNQQLKSLNLKNMYADPDYEMTVIIESAPKLASFSYEGNINFGISMESFNSLDGKFVIHNLRENCDANEFISMMNFLLNLNCFWRIVTLHVLSDEVLIVPENLKRICPFSSLNWKHLRVKTDKKPKSESKLKESLMWISPTLETLCINEKEIF
ncbi:FBD-associated F-box protein At5g60610-like [Humulus lupulus]|uniref:FBD-associated F-box protein At5g60610-like n=1 Tax=Humulus lupulus TaxID=3486 RepID=UPI002B403EA6|nr:FBD-associated F-box protein At5g60610-like [Humulus lupulus]